MKSCMIFSIGLAAGLLTSCGHQDGASAPHEPSVAGDVAAVVAEAANPSAVADVDACKLLSKEEAATVLDNPGPPEPGDSGISKECKYSNDTDHLELSVNVLPNDKDKMATFQAVYDPKDITQIPGVGDVAFEFFQNPGEIREQDRFINVLKGSTRFTLTLYRKTGQLGEPFNAKLVAIAKAVADRL